MEEKDLLSDILAELAGTGVLEPKPNVAIEQKVEEKEIILDSSDIIEVKDDVEAEEDIFSGLDMNKLGQDVIKDYLSKILLAVTHLKKEIKELKESRSGFNSAFDTTATNDLGFSNIDINSPFPDEVMAAKASLKASSLGGSLTPGDLVSGPPINMRTKASYPVYQESSLKAKFPNGVPAGVLSEEQAFAAMDKATPGSSSSLMQDSVNSMSMAEMTNTPEARRQLLQMNATAGIKVASGAVPSVPAPEKQGAYNRTTPPKTNLPNFSGRF